MQVTQTQSEGLKRGFTITVPANDLEVRRAARFVELGKSVRLPGFRPGKVPATLIAKRYSEAVESEILEQVVNESSSKVLEEHGLRPATQPKIELVSNGQQGKDLEITLELEVLPEIQMPEFSALELTRFATKPTDEVIEKALGELSKRQRSFEKLEEDRPASIGDVVNCNFVGKREGVPFEGGTAEAVDVEIGGTGFIPGFAEQLEGLRPGEEKVITVTFPEQYHSKELVGQEATFDIKVNEIKIPVDATLDDDFAKKLGFEDMKQLRDLVVKQSEGEYAQLSRLRLKRDLLDALYEKVEFDAPQSLVENEFAQIWQRFEQERKQDTSATEDAEKDEAALHAEYRSIAERRVKLGLLLAEIGRVNEITVTREEMIQAVRQEAQRYPGQEKVVFDFFAKNPQAAENLRGPILENKVIDYIIELANVAEKEVSPEELAEKASSED